MTDDLIRRANYALGDTQGRVDVGKLALFADCITRIEELEAKLAKAVGALGRIADDCEADCPPSHGAIKHDARTTIAELKGEKGE